LLGDQVIEGKKTKKLLINRWLYTHKIWGILGSPLYKKKPLSSSHTHTTQKNMDLIFTKTLNRQPQWPKTFTKQPFLPQAKEWQNN
jgi:hypothetical protein